MDHFFRQSSSKPQSQSQKKVGWRGVAQYVSACSSSHFARSARACSHRFHSYLSDRSSSADSGPWSPAEDAALTEAVQRVSSACILPAYLPLTHTLILYPVSTFPPTTRIRTADLFSAVLCCAALCCNVM